MSKNHWSFENPQAYEYAILSDFISQLQQHMDDQGLTRQDVAKKTGLSEERIHLIFNRPNNIRFMDLIILAKSLNLEVSIVAYKYNKASERGPVNSEIFAECWKRIGSPQDFFDLEELTTPHP